PNTYALSLHDALPIWPAGRVNEKVCALGFARSARDLDRRGLLVAGSGVVQRRPATDTDRQDPGGRPDEELHPRRDQPAARSQVQDRKSTRLNSSHQII